MAVEGRDDGWPGGETGDDRRGAPPLTGTSARAITLRSGHHPPLTLADRPSNTKRQVFSDSITDEHGARVRVKLPALGLSNVVDDERGDDQREDDINNHHASITEEDLSQNTLWPEVQKLYGHGNDLFSVTADPRGRYVASSSRAQEQTSAAVIIWDTTTWTEVARNVGTWEGEEEEDLGGRRRRPGGEEDVGYCRTVCAAPGGPARDGESTGTASCGIRSARSGRAGRPSGVNTRPSFYSPSVRLSRRFTGHDLTVTCMACSPSGNLLATVGRDRKMIVWQMKSGVGPSAWRMAASESKAHARVIWGCSWLDERRLVTCSRDGVVRVWDVDVAGDAETEAETEAETSGRVACRAATKLGSSVMSVSCDPGGGSLFAAGLESGEVLILDVVSGNAGACSIEVVAACPEESRHAGAVRRVEWRPGAEGVEGAEGEEGEEGVEGEGRTGAEGEGRTGAGERQRADGREGRTGAGERERADGGAALVSSVGDDGAVKFWSLLRVE